MTDEASRRRAIVPVSDELLIDALRMPVGSVIRNVRMSFEYPNAVEFIVEHPQLAIVEEGMAFPRVPYIVRTERHECPADGSVWTKVGTGEWSLPADKLESANHG